MGEHPNTSNRDYGSLGYMTTVLGFVWFSRSLAELVEAPSIKLALHVQGQAVGLPTRHVLDPKVLEGHHPNR